MFERIYLGVLFYKLNNISEIQRQTNRCRVYILKTLRALGLKNKQKNLSYSRGKRSKHYNWKNGKSLAWNGYIRVLKPEHPRALENGYVWEHILVAEKKLKRPLLYFGKGDPRNENVHHINGIKSDNRPKNVCVMTTLKQHADFEWENEEIKFPQSKASRKETPERYLNWLNKNRRRK